MPSTVRLATSWRQRPATSGRMAYRGLVLDLAAVDARLVASQDETFVVWSLIAEAIDDAMSAVIALRL